MYYTDDKTSIYNKFTENYYKFGEKIDEQIRNTIQI